MLKSSYTDLTEDQLLALKPSELLILALKDLKICESEPGTFVQMDGWYWEEERNQDSAQKACFVCLAGAVMKQTLKVSPSRDISTMPQSLSRKILHRMGALNLFRSGRISAGLRAFYENDLDQLYLPYDPTIQVTSYAAHPRSFYSDMEKVVSILQSLEEGR